MNKCKIKESQTNKLMERRIKWGRQKMSDGNNSINEQIS